MAAQGTAFNRESAGFPIGLFGQVVDATPGTETRSFILQNKNKGELTEVEMAQRAINEEEWLSEVMHDHVAAVVMHQVLSAAHAQVLTADTPESYWENVKQATDVLKSAGLHPLLLLDNQTRPEWVWDWQHSAYGSVEDFHRRPSDMTVTKNESEASAGYIMHLNDIAVFDAPIPIGSSYILARELFQSIGFLRFTNGHRISAEWRDSTSDFAKGDLILNWGAEVQLRDAPVYRIRYSKD
jgi:hypothetical protein